MTEQELIKALRDRGPLSADTPKPKEETTGTDKPKPEVKGGGKGNPKAVQKGPKKGGKKRKGRRASRKRLKLTDSNWEQAFLISYLPEFVQARESYFPKEMGAVERVGEFVGIHGNQADMLGLLVDATQVDAFANLTAAQASSLVPLISIYKDITPEAKALYPDAPDLVPIRFGDHLDVSAVRELMAGKPAALGGVGIKDVHIIRKFGKRGPQAGGRSEVELTFGFDSMETFVKNQRAGVSFLDLIPTGIANMKTAGRKDVLWNLRFKFGYHTPDDASGLVWRGLQGQRAKAAVAEMNRSWQLMYGGKHDILIDDNGGVELKIKFLTTSEALEGEEAQMRSDILGKPTGMMSKEQQKERKDLEQSIEEGVKQSMVIQANMDKAEATFQKEIQQEQENYLKTIKAEEFMSSALGLPTSAKEWSGGANYGNQYIADKDLIDEFHNAVEHGNPKAVDHEAYEEAKEAFTKKLKSAAEARKAGINKQLAEMEKQQTWIHAQHQKLADLGSADGGATQVLETRYASLMARLHQSERLYCLDLTPKEVSDYSSKSQSEQRKKHKTFKGKLLERLEGKPPKDWYSPPKDANENDIQKFIHSMVKKYAGKDAEMKTSAKSQKPLDGWALRSKRIYYFYLGDLLDLVMTNFYANAQSPVGGADKSQKKDRTNTVHLMMGDFYYNLSTKKQKTRKHVKPPPESVAYNMMDFPISMSSFSRFFVDRFVRTGTEHISVETFLSELANYFFGQPIFAAAEKYSYGPMLNPDLPYQQWHFVFGDFVSGVKLERGWQQKTSKRAMYDMNSDEMKKMFMRGKPEDQKVLHSYLWVGPGHAANLNTIPIFTFHMGAENSIIKSVKFNASGGSKRTRTTRIHKAREAKKAMPKLPVAAAYTVDLELMGCPFFAPGMCFELNNNVFGINTMGELPAGSGMALTKEGDDLLEIFPRLLRVSEVSHKISESEFSTSVKCRPTGLTYKKYMDSRGDELYNLTSIATNLKKPMKEANAALAKKKRKQ